MGEKHLTKLHTALRLSSASFDETELIPLVEACEIDLSISGVKTVDIDNPLVWQAVILYCKANFGYYENSEKYVKAYEALKAALALTSEISVIEDEQ